MPDDGTAGRPEVPRGELRRVLLESLPSSTIGGGHKLTTVSSLGEGVHALTFANGSPVTTDFLLGADGAWSRVRPLLSDAKPANVGTAFVETYLYESDMRDRASAQAVGDRALFACPQG